MNNNSQQGKHSSEDIFVIKYMHDSKYMLNFKMYVTGTSGREKYSLIVQQKITCEG